MSNFGELFFFLHFRLSSQFQKDCIKESPQGQNWLLRVQPTSTQSNWFLETTAKVKMQELLQYELEWNLFVAVFLFQRDIARPISRCLSASSASGSSPSPFLFIKMFSPSNVGIIFLWTIRCVTKWTISHGSINLVTGWHTLRYRICLTKISDWKPSEFLETGPVFEKMSFDKFLDFRHILVSLHGFSEVNFFSFVSELRFFHSMNRYCYQIIRQ